MKFKKLIYLYHTILLIVIVITSAMVFTNIAIAADDNPVLSTIEEYMDFTEYSSSLIWPEQIPKQDWKKIFVIDARDAKQYAKENIPGSEISSGGRLWHADQKYQMIEWWSCIAIPIHYPHKRFSHYV